MFRLISLCWLSFLVAFLLPPGSTHATEMGWRYDTVHSQVLFSISHNGYSRPFGRLHIARGWLRFNPDDWSTAATELDIDLASVDMGDADWNAAVCKPALLDCAHQRYAHFVSTGVQRTDERHGVLHGQLTLRGVTRPVDLSFAFNRAARTTFEMHEVAGFSATAMLDRNHYDITANRHSIGAQVSVYLELELIRDDHAIPPTKEQP